MNDFLLQQWQALTAGLPDHKEAIGADLVRRYTAPGRHYHNLGHIEQMLRLTETHQLRLEAPDPVRWAIWYHDAVYSPSRSDNEAQSAKLARLQMYTLEVDAGLISRVASLIRATRTHELPPELDTFDARFFLDTDLATLGAAWETYLLYTQQIRREYRLYPDLRYRRGREKGAGPLSQKATHLPDQSVL